MLKSEIIRRVTEQLDKLYKSDVEAIVNATFEEIQNALDEGERVEFRGFGTFSTKHRSARTARNPRDGSPLEIPARTVAHFKPSRQLLDRLNS